MITQIARFLLRWRSRQIDREFNQHLAHCTKRACILYLHYGNPENQDETMFCPDGRKIWVRSFDMSQHAESIPE